MKRFGLFSFLLILFFISACVSYDVKDKDPASFVIPAYQVKEDFKTFRTTIEKAHPSLYTYISKDRFKKIFDSVEAGLGKKITYRAFYNKLYYLVNELGCSHSVIRLPSFVYDSLFYRELFFPLPVLLVENKLLVNGDYDLPHGTEIISINNRPVSAMLDSLMFYNAVEGFHRSSQRNMAAGEFSYQLFMKFGGQKAFSLEIIDTGGKKKTKILYAISLEDVFTRQSVRYYFDATDVDYSMIIYDDEKRATMRICTFTYDTDTKQKAFDAFLKNSFELLRKRPDIKTLLIDLRENGGGYLRNCFLLNSYITRSAFDEYREVYSRIKYIPFSGMLSPRFDKDELYSINSKLREDFERRSRGYFMKRDAIEFWVPDENRFNGDVFILTNWNVNSAASYFALLAKNTAGAKVVGTETAGGTYSGNGFRTLIYTLPETKMEFEFPYAKMLYSNGDSYSGKGLVPDYIVTDNHESFMGNKDRQQLYVNDSLMKKPLD